MKNILIIGSGLIGSSVLRAVHARKLSRNIYVYEKISRYITITNRLIWFNIMCENWLLSKMVYLYFTTYNSSKAYGAPLKISPHDT